jgi:hypothetical protein
MYSDYSLVGSNTMQIISIGINSLRTKLYLPDLKTQSVLLSKHSCFVYKQDKLMLYTEITVLCYEIHAKPYMHCR